MRIDHDEVLIYDKMISEEYMKKCENTHRFVVHYQAIPEFLNERDGNLGC